MPGELPGGCHVALSERSDGDLGTRAGRDPTAARRRLVDLEWCTLEQVHGATVLLADDEVATAPPAGDALVTTRPGRALAVFGADCPLVAFVSNEGVIGVAHAGWRGLLGGVLQGTVALLRAKGASAPVALLGPSIGPECYAFGPEELAAMATRYGPSVRSQTAGGTPALDLRAAVRLALFEVGVEAPCELGGCTGCDLRWYSHRARKEAARHALVVWREARS